MWSARTQEDEMKVLSWKDFPADAHNGPGREDSPLTPQIAAYLRQILERFEESEFIKYLVTPSPVALSGFFHCTEPDIYSALKELQRQGYEYEVSSSAGPITLWDPLIRRRPLHQGDDEPTPWQTFRQTLFNSTRHPATGKA